MYTSISFYGHTCVDTGVAVIIWNLLPTNIDNYGLAYIYSARPERSNSHIYCWLISNGLSAHLMLRFKHWSCGTQLLSRRNYMYMQSNVGF